MSPVHQLFCIQGGQVGDLRCPRSYLAMRKLHQSIMEKEPEVLLGLICKMAQCASNCITLLTECPFLSSFGGKSRFELSSSPCAFSSFQLSSLSPINPSAHGNARLTYGILLLFFSEPWPIRNLQLQQPGQSFELSQPHKPPEPVLACVRIPELPYQARQQWGEWIYRCLGPECTSREGRRGVLICAQDTLSLL